MVGGRLRCLSCYFFTLSFWLLLRVCLHNAEASGEKRVINKNVGDSVELSPNVPTEGITEALWTYEKSTVAYKGSGVTKNNPFQDRLEFNNSNFSLTLKKLTLQDSGDFQFVSEVKDQQRPPVIITLQVHDVIKKPTLTSIITHHPANGSCTVLLECSEPSTISVNYSLTFGIQTQRVRSLQRTIRPEDGATTVNCTVSNAVSEMSASETVTCSNKTSGPLGKLLVLILPAAGGSLLLLIIIITVSVCLCKQRQGGSDSNELTVYADISDVAAEAGTSAKSKPCSLYDMIENTTQTAVPQGPHTVYDKIQFDRMKKPSVSPYQEVS